MDSHRLTFFALLLAIPLVLAVPGPARAVEVELTPFVGYGSTDYDHRQGLVCLAIFADCVLEAEAGEGTSFGIVVGFDLAPGWQLEILADRTESDLDARASAISLNPQIPDILIEEELELETTHLHAGVSRTFGVGSVRPFVGASLGVSRVEADSGGSDPDGVGLHVFLAEDVSDDSFSARAAGGVKIGFSDHLGLRLEGRGWWVDFDEEAGGDFVQLDATAGLTVRW